MIFALWNLSLYGYDPTFQEAVPRVQVVLNLRPLLGLEFLIHKLPCLYLLTGLLRDCLYIDIFQLHIKSVVRSRAYRS